MFRTFVVHEGTFGACRHYEWWPQARLQSQRISVSLHHSAS